MNKKGFYSQLMLVAILAVVLVGIFAIFYFVSLVSPIIEGSSEDIRNIIVNEMPGSDANAKQASTIAMDSVVNTTDVLQWFALALFITLSIGFLGMCYFVRTYRFLIIIWIFVIIIGAVLSFYVTNSYLDISSGEFQEYYEANTTNHFLMSHLPHLVIVLGIASGIILYSISMVSPEEEGGNIGI